VGASHWVEAVGEQAEEQVMDDVGVVVEEAAADSRVLDRVEGSQ
jgi:hypothetical protein